MTFMQGVLLAFLAGDAVLSLFALSKIRAKNRGAFREACAAAFFAFCAGSGTMALTWSLLISSLLE